MHWWADERDEKQRGLRRVYSWQWRRWRTGKCGLRCAGEVKPGGSNLTTSPAGTVEKRSRSRSLTWEMSTAGSRDERCH